MTASARWQAAYNRGEVIEILMAELDHPLGMGFFYDGAGDIDYNGVTYHGWGKLVSIELPASTGDIEIPEVRYILSGVDPAVVERLDGSVKGRLATMYGALLDRHYRVVERELVSEAQLDYQRFTIDKDGKATVTIVANGGFYRLRNRSAAKLSPEQQKAKFPDDTGYDEIHLQEDLSLSWRAA